MTFSDSGGIQRRAIFPTLMFGIALVSFAYGTWQYFYARAVQASAEQRLAFVVTSIEQSGVAAYQKQQLYVSIMNGLPASPRVLGIDFSGSFASQNSTDSCTSEGQRSVCRALGAQSTDPATYSAICGMCKP